MKTVKEVAKLTGVSIRTLQYYDEIGLFKPTRTSASGYRLYDEESLKELQQILFFKELDFQLKDIKKIMDDPHFDKISAFQEQKKLIEAKRNRLNGLLELLEKLEKGETCMSFKEFDMSDFIAALEKFKKEKTTEIIEHWGSMEEFDELISRVKNKESDIAKVAIKQYGSIEKYTEAMKDNLEHFSERMESLNQLKEVSHDYIEENKKLTKELVSDLSEDVRTERIQKIIHKMVTLNEKMTPQGIDMGENYWDMIIDCYLKEGKLNEINDKLYGSGASNYMGKALQYYFQKKREIIE